MGFAVKHIFFIYCLELPAHSSNKKSQSQIFISFTKDLQILQTVYFWYRKLWRLDNPTIFL